ncbi:hypothetical protein [Spirosoma sp. KNUC1025]|uniref:hypothetical protein n=1 Tax=Spirosoma sp. KNUC1025 TaxID=2894082 RepID=UPI00386C8363|nr:hypothetical protein LN737_29665 [Spirosoma sp. KNUC1025]
MQGVNQSNPPLRILYVENDNQQVQSFQQAFQSQADVINVPDGKSALAHLNEKAAIDLILYNDELDSVPFLNGLRSNRSVTRLPVVLLTDRSGIDLSAQPFQGYVIDAFPHNYEAEDLRLRLNYLIQKKNTIKKGISRRSRHRSAFQLASGCSISGFLFSYWQWRRPYWSLWPF